MWGEGSDIALTSAFYLKQSSVLCLLKVSHCGAKTTRPDSVLTLQCVDIVCHTCTDAELKQK